MKMWRQLEAIAKRQGLVLEHGDCTWQLNNVAADDVARGEWWMSSDRKNQFVLRAMCEAALGEIARKR